jgi:hypothetical protein
LFFAKASVATASAVFTVAGPIVRNAPLAALLDKSTLPIVGSSTDTENIPWFEIISMYMIHFPFSPD